MTKNDLKKCAKEIGEQLKNNYLSAQMQYLVLNGHIAFNGYFISHDCTKNYLHLTIQSPPVGDTVMILQISVDNKNQSNEGGDKSQDENPSQEISMTPSAAAATTTMTTATMAAVAAMKKRAYEWAHHLWNGEYKSEYSTTDRKDEEFVKNIIQDFSAILSSSSWDTEFESLDPKEEGKKSEEVSSEHLAMQYVCM